MKLAKFFSFLMFCFLCCTAHAEENQYIFIGQNGSGTSAKVAFVLEVTSNDLGDSIQINENGEVYLKVDKIVAIPKESLLAFASQNLTECATKAAAGDDYSSDECPKGHPSRHGDGRCNQSDCPFFRGN